MSEENEQISEDAVPVQPAAEIPVVEEVAADAPVESPKARKSRKKGKRAAEPEPEEQPAPEPLTELEEPAGESTNAEEPAVAEEVVAKEIATEEVAASEEAVAEVADASSSVAAVDENPVDAAPGEGAEPVAAEEPVEQPEVPFEPPKAGKSRKKGKRAAESAAEEPAAQDPSGESTEVSSDEGVAEGVSGEISLDALLPESPAAETEGEAQEAMEPADEGTRHELPLVVEAILFASQKPMSAKEILSVFKGAADAAKEIPDAPARAFAKIKEPHLREAIESLEIACAAPDRAYEVRESAAGWQLVTKPQYSPWLRQLFPEHRSARLSAPAMETLAIIAYRQPITRADIEAVRGVAVDGVMQTLLDRGLVKIAGRADVPGRPLLYDTTQNFMEHFGLKDLDDLPNAQELRKISLPTAEPPPAETPAASEKPAPAAPEQPASPETPSEPAPPAETESPAEPEPTAEVEHSAEVEPSPEAEPVAEAEPSSEAEPSAAAEPFPEAEPAAEPEPEPAAEPAEESLVEPAPEPEIPETPIENSPEASEEEKEN